MLSILQRLPLLPLNSSGILYPRNKSQELFPVNVEKVFLTFMEARGTGAVRRDPPGNADGDVEAAGRGLSRMAG